MKIKIVSIFILCLAAIGQLSAKDPIDVAIHSSGKIYLVVGTLAVIFIGIAIYLFSIDRNLSKIEKQIKDNE